MSRKTVNQIMIDIASSVNQEATAPTPGGAEFDLWLQFMNRSQDEWSQANDWEEQKEFFFPSITTDNQATVLMPTNFIKVAASPKVHNGSSATEDFLEIPETKTDITSQHNTTDNYFYQIGNPGAGVSLVFHPATLCSGASVEIQYYSTPTSLATTTQYVTMSDPQFVIDRTIAYIFEARSDPRFQQQESKARDKLMMMIENANLSKYNSYSNPQYVQTSPLRKMGFRVGRD